MNTRIERLIRTVFKQSGGLGAACFRRSESLDNLQTGAQLLAVAAEVLAGACQDMQTREADTHYQKAQKWAAQGWSTRNLDSENHGAGGFLCYSLHDVYQVRVILALPDTALLDPLEGPHLVFDDHDRLVPWAVLDHLSHLTEEKEVVAGR